MVLDLEARCRLERDDPVFIVFLLYVSVIFNLASDPGELFRKAFQALVYTGNKFGE